MFQVNSVHLGEKGCPSGAEGFFNAQDNASCALVVYNGQQRGSSDPLNGVSKAWAAYRAHQPECASYKLPTALASAPAASASASVTPAPPTTGANDSSAGVGDDDDIPPPGSGTANPAGSCFAGTLGQSLPAGGCYQRKQDGLWFQCHAGLWYRGVGGDGTTGPYGDCDPSLPLEP